METLAFSTCAYCHAPTAGPQYCCLGCQVLDGKFHEKSARSPKYIHLDQPNFIELYRNQTSDFDFQVYVEGLHCAACVHLLEQLPQYDEGVVDARVDYSQSQVFLKVGNEFSLARIATTLNAWGYSPHFLRPTESVRNQQVQENRAFLKKLAITGACAGNIMLFVVPIYSGLEGPLALIFNWIGFFLFLPVLLYSGTVFYRGALNSFIYRSISVDLPITVALIGGFLFSTVNLVRGKGEIYFDSTASFIFLILAARYVLKRTQQKFFSYLELADLLEQDHYSILSNSAIADVEKVVSHREIQAGDRILLRAGQIAPVDGIIQSDKALVDIAVLNGEPLPRIFERGMSILGGSKVLSEKIEVLVTASESGTQMAVLLEELRSGLWKKSMLLSLADQWAQRLIVTVFAIAIGFFIYYAQFDVEQAFNRSLALIVIACPCALAFGSSLALSVALKKAQEQGILVRNANAFEKILKIKNLFFDKTGTLTDLDLQITDICFPQMTEEIKEIVLSLEQTSSHPVAFAFRKAWPTTQIMAVQDLKEELGKGVSGTIQGSFYELGLRTDSKDLALHVALRKQGVELGYFRMESLLQKDSVISLKKLSAAGLQFHLLSGDHQERVLKVAQDCGIPESQCYFDQSPEDKKSKVGSFPFTCMVGDGSNDSLALREADVGVAVKGSTFLNMKSADIFLTRQGLSPLVDLFALARNTRTVLVRNLSFSLIYNFIGAVLALSGLVTPWLAAILMPISSLIIILSTIWGFR